MEKITIEKDIAVICVQATSFPQGIEAAFRELENLIPATDKRICFGISHPDKNRTIIYKAAVEEKVEDEAKRVGLETFVINKGTYISQLIQDYKKDIRAIGNCFQQLLHQPDIDPNGYCLEWYKDNDEVLCMVGLDTEKQKDNSDADQ